MPKVVLAGGTGFVGRAFERRFREMGYEIGMISRQASHISWDDRTGMTQALEGADLLVNLAGRSVNCRYTLENRRLILESRTETTRLLGECVLACRRPPALWINSSTATIYRHAEDRPMTEEGGEIGAGFSVDVAKAWEQAFFAFDLPATRQIALRIAIVLDDGGVMGPMRNLVRFGLGGPQGSGRQQFSWIHMEDLFRIVMFLQQHPKLDGVFNASAPHPVTNRELMAGLRRAMGIPIGLPAPRWMLELGARLIRTETELVLKSRWVLPERLLQAGYTFKYDTLDAALKEILSR
ncbi:MAG: TIGR01777 family oxidoreductase [Paenibacillus macerans]|uniref:TIGR01777 family protein n=1 Tax=Paenibacillus macerans TaxID=44252 RepID=A0A6N8F6D3_PAEMA|nr:TIGR01777 family oxidoreductase [Paenibacillus macerans]MBS5914475.1 TIGR01777 family oxidoreductase [Paenibacillus macerans]MDU5948272.1 TIGR01777 family oxidoreductase [Paenibacillus macerans]MDU7476761.1 TIGR01777 family oxidoreductase [Paenibacillus macerans]MEC0135457.1 TIGR01777 family oxidoreductase [Paenibacillus macerans]MUG26730.1 TIGR01777 family protein [Paenibacillus macerans]